MSTSGWIRTASATALCLGLLAACVADRAGRRDNGPYGISLPGADGQVLDFAAFRGRVLLVDFFTTWNQASMLAIPGYTALYRKHRERGLAMVGVALDELGADTVVPYVQGMRIPYPVVLADTDMKRGQSFFGNLSTLPLLLVFDRQGRLRKAFVGHVPLREVEQALEPLLR